MKNINTSSIKALHDVNDLDKLQNLKESMTNGWDGRPILVIDLGNEGYQALTGTHRINAAIQLGFEEIPCEVINNDLFNQICEDCQWDIDTIIRDLESFALDLKDYDSLYDLLKMD